MICGAQEPAAEILAGGRSARRCFTCAHDTAIDEGYRQRGVVLGYGTSRDHLPQLPVSKPSAKKFALTNT